MGKGIKPTTEKPMPSKKKMKKLRRKVTNEMVEDLYGIIQVQREAMEILRAERERFLEQVWNAHDEIEEHLYEAISKSTTTAEDVHDWIEGETSKLEARQEKMMLQVETILGRLERDK